VGGAVLCSVVVVVVAPTNDSSLATIGPFDEFAGVGRSGVHATRTTIGVVALPPNGRNIAVELKVTAHFNGGLGDNGSSSGGEGGTAVTQARL
jgi:hypothetical protein